MKFIMSPLGVHKIIVNSFVIMNPHSHLQFYSNTERERQMTLGGHFMPTLQFNDAKPRIKSTNEKNADIVEYLRTIPRDTRASFVDIKNGTSSSSSSPLYHEYK